MKTFAELDLIPPVQKALAHQNYETPTPIQAQTIPPALLGQDVLGCAQTGTGKTAAFALPILHELGQRNRRATPNRPLALVLAPTRELAIQIGESFATYGRHLKLRSVLVYGGVNQNQQVRALDRGAHILVATPGRLLDLMNQGHIELDQLEVFVLDEADRMLDMGFLPDLKRIISKLPRERQSLFFSATLPPKIVELSNRLLFNPISVNVTPKSTSVDRIEQRVLFVDRGGKQSLLNQILGDATVERAIVFTRTKRTANMVTQKLERSGIAAAVIHGNKSQNARQRALDAFRRKKVQVLVATDVAARGIDIDGITHVINYDLPNEPEAYVHRIGRTGRAGAEGVALSFCSGDQRDDLRAIERLIGQKIPVALNQTSSSGQANPKSGHGGSDSRSRKTPAPSRRSRNASSRNRNASSRTPGSNESRPQRSEAGFSADASVPEKKPKSRPRRKGPRRGERAKQTT